MRKGGSVTSYENEASMDLQPDLKYVIGWNYYTMKFLGIWPEERKWNRLSNYLILAPFLMMLCFICIPQTINLFLIWNDLNLVVENLSMGNITVTLSAFKAIAFWINGRPLKSLLEQMADDWDALSKKDERETMTSIARIARKTTIRCTVMCQSVVATYVFLRYFSMKYNGSKLLFRAYFPYDIDISPNYELTVLAQFVAAFYTASNYTAVDTFVAMLIFHVCGQLSVLKQKLRKLHEHDKADLNEKLRKIAQKHEHINRFTETVEKCFNMMLLIQMLVCTVQLCFQCFQAIMALDMEEKEYLILQVSFLVLYLIYVLLQLYLYCYVGERLSVESMEIANAAYECEWYNLSPNNVKLIMMIVHRARLPLRITAGRFCAFTLMLYSQVLKTSIGYVSVLYATKNKQAP